MHFFFVLIKRQKKNSVLFLCKTLRRFRSEAQGVTILSGTESELRIWAGCRLLADNRESCLIQNVQYRRGERFTAGGGAGAGQCNPFACRSAGCLQRFWDTNCKNADTFPQPSTLEAILNFWNSQQFKTREFLKKENGR
ncbi:UNVERIFIED_CONTAM: hypothetical protein K2H54_045606 [Gekko kuhli]